MSGAADGLLWYGALVLIALLAHESWRWLGYALGRRINPQGEIFKWVKAVSTALVAALVARLLLFPAGALASIPLWLRLLAFAVAISVYLRTQTVWHGVLAGALLIAAGKLALQ